MSCSTSNSPEGGLLHGDGVVLRRGNRRRSVPLTAITAEQHRSSQSLDSASYLTEKLRLAFLRSVTHPQYNTARRIVRQRANRP